MSDVKAKIISLGGKEWIKGDMHRVYIDNGIHNILRAEEGLNEVSFGERNNKVWFDVAKNAVLRSYKQSKNPTIEIQY